MPPGEESLKIEGTSMGSMLKKFKKGKGKASPSLDPRIMEAYNQGYDAGAKEQRLADIEHTVNFLENLESLPGIGVKTAEKIRDMFLKQFGR